MKKVEIAIVHGSEGYSLQVYGKSSGYRFDGPKAWGNPCNKPTATFIVNVDEFIKCLEKYSYEEKEEENKNV